MAAPPLKEGQAEARFAMGCFWCAESDFEHVPGVIDAVSGYAGGHTTQPTYHEVGSGSTGHAEAIRVIYDPTKVTYPELLATFWHGIDPFDGGGQFCDHGSQYRPAIFPLDDAQRTAAEASLKAVEKDLGKPVAVKLEDGGTFWVAEDYHQDFWKTNAEHYQRYRMGCGRDARTKAVWGTGNAH
ncbi:MAG: peptide-methionine (S)-S-oxide reductase MsrA [Alphaproteobacteria bacterium]|nr:peptide-methionine (S)-S-oxide reductase MsrA [Alphaproteobacteria bacterium]